MPDGRRVHRTKHFLTRAAAGEWVKQYNARSDLRLIGRVIPIKLSDAAAEFLLAATGLRPQTRSSYRTAVVLLVADIGDVLTGQVDGPAIDAFLAKRIAAASPTTAAKHLRSLKRFFYWCLERGYCSVNPVGLATSPPRGRARRERPELTDKAIARIIKALDTDDRRMAAWIALTTGLDRNVIASLTADQVAWESRAIRLARPKTGRDVVVPIHPMIFSWLARRREQCPPQAPLLRGLTRQHRTRDWWADAADRAGCPGVWFRDLRAVAASRAQRLAGLSLRDTQELLGHASPLTTAAHYHTPDSTTAQRLGLLPLPGFRETKAARARKPAPSRRRKS
jgi:integrase